MATCWATGMAMPVVRSGPVVRMSDGKRSTKASPEKKEGWGFIEQLVEWTQRSSLPETDPVLRRTEKKEKKGAAEPPPPPTEKKGFFGF